MSRFAGFLTRHNPLWPTLLAFAAAIGYLITATHLGWYQRIPVVSLLLLAASVVWVLLSLCERKTIPRFVGLLVILALTALFSWWTLSSSEYAERDEAVHDGEIVGRLLTMELPDHAGIDRPILAEGEATLLVLYRGHW